MKYVARVFAGRGEGKKMGFPTLNLEIPLGFETRPGIYAGWIWLNPLDEVGALPAAIHYGPTPTFNIETLSLEAYVLDSNILEPPKEVAVELVSFIREIKTFADAAALAAAIEDDVKKVRLALEKVG